MLCVTLFIFSTEIRRMYKCVSHGYEITRSETCIGMERKKLNKEKEEVGAND